MAESLFATEPVFVDSAAVDAAERAERAQRLDSELRAKAAGAWKLVPELFRSTPVLDLMAVIAPKLRQKVNSSETVSAVFLGPTGCGKSVSASILVRRALATFVQSGGQRFEVATDLCWTDASDIAMANPRHPLGAGVPELLARSTSCGLLVLDDVGIETLEGAVFPVLQARYHGRRPTIVTSGLTQPQLTKHLSAAGVRRCTSQHTGMPMLFVDCHEKPPSKPAPPRKDPTP